MNVIQLIPKRSVYMALDGRIPAETESVIAEKIQAAVQKTVLQQAVNPYAIHQMIIIGGMMENPIVKKNVTIIMKMMFLRLIAH